MCLNKRDISVHQESCYILTCHSICVHSGLLLIQQGITHFVSITMQICTCPTVKACILPCYQYTEIYSWIFYADYDNGEWTCNTVRIVISSYSKLL
jgi:hypothetical protein